MRARSRTASRRPSACARTSTSPGRSRPRPCTFTRTSARRRSRRAAPRSSTGASLSLSLSLSDVPLAERSLTPSARAQHRGVQRREDRHPVLQGRRPPEPDRHHHAVRGSALVHRVVHAAQRRAQEGPVQGDRGRLGRRVPGPREGLHHHELRSQQRAPGYRLPQRPAPPQRRPHARQVRPRHPGQPESPLQGASPLLARRCSSSLGPHADSTPSSLPCSTPCGTTSSRTTRRRSASSRARSTTSSRR